MGPQLRANCHSYREPEIANQTRYHTIESKEEKERLFFDA